MESEDCKSELEDEVKVVDIVSTEDMSKVATWIAEDSCNQIIEGNDILQFNLK